MHHGSDPMSLSEFMSRIDDNPYYPVDLADYPGMFDFRITQNGMVYLERLREELESGSEFSDAKCLYMGILYLGYAVATRSPKECKGWQVYMFLVGKTTDMYTPEIKADLMQMGCIEDNPEYNPKLYKRHLIWKMKALTSTGCGGPVMVEEEP